MTSLVGPLPVFTLDFVIILLVIIGVSIIIYIGNMYGGINPYGWRKP